LYFSFTSLSIVLGLLFEALHSGLFVFLYRHHYRRTAWVRLAEKRRLHPLVRTVYVARLRYNHQLVSVAFRSVGEEECRQPRQRIRCLAMSQNTKPGITPMTNPNIRNPRINEDLKKRSPSCTWPQTGQRQRPFGIA